MMAEVGEFNINMAADIIAVDSAGFNGSIIFTAGKIYIFRWFFEIRVRHGQGGAILQNCLALVIIII